MQRWFIACPTPPWKKPFFDTPLYREFAQLQELSRLPDESTVLRFRHRLEDRKLSEQILQTVNDLLTERGLLHGQDKLGFGMQATEALKSARMPKLMPCWISLNSSRQALGPKSSTRFGRSRGSLAM